MDPPAAAMNSGHLCGTGALAGRRFWQ